LRLCLILLLCLFPRPATWAYGVLTHEAIIDAVWESSIIPALRLRFPTATPDSLQACRRWAYGGAIMPDMGYFPRESRLFSDLLHYARTGDFVQTLSDSARTPSEYAFALGALAHYTADRYGHPIGVNRAVPLAFPELRAEHGPMVEYEDDPTAHVRAEFGFDVLQTARNAYASQAYDGFLDFAIADSLLHRAFRATYGLEVDSLFGNYERSVRTFRWAVGEVFPAVTRQAWKSRKEAIRERQPTATARAFRYRLRRATFRKQYGAGRDKPGLSARVLAKVARFLPKLGPLKALKPVIPRAEAEALFIQSFDTVVAQYPRMLLTVQKSRSLQNVNYDTGDPSTPGRYPLADEAHARWLLSLREKGWIGATSVTRKHLLQYFSIPTKLDEDTRADVAAALEELQRTSYRD